MTDYPKALAALRWALDLQAKVGKADTIARFAGHARVTKRARDLLAALDAARGEAVAWVDVADAESGPYEFHGIEKLPAGKHHLFSAPPAALAVPAGYALVPAEPTQGMLDAAGMCIVPDGKEWLDQSNRETWAAMLAAANKENNNG